MRARILSAGSLLFICVACSGGSDTVVMSEGVHEAEIDPKYNDAFRVANFEVTVATGIEADGTIRVESLSKAAGDITTRVSKADTLKQFDAALAMRDDSAADASSSDKDSAAAIALTDYPALPAVGSIDVKTSQALPHAVISQNAPNAAAQTFIADALPDGADSSADFADCSKTATRTVAAFAKNFLGITVAEVEYTISYQYQCRFNGGGLYLANVRLFPSKVFVFWGFQLDFSIAKMLVTNIGTEDEPVAQMQLHSHLSLRSPLSLETRDQVVSVNGKSGAVTTN